MDSLTVDLTELVINWEARHARIRWAHFAVSPDILSTEHYETSAMPWGLLQLRSWAPPGIDGEGHVNCQDTVMAEDDTGYITGYHLWAPCKPAVQPARLPLYTYSHWLWIDAYMICIYTYKYSNRTIVTSTARVSKTLFSTICFWLDIRRYQKLFDRSLQ